MTIRNITLIATLFASASAMAAPPAPGALELVGPEVIVRGMKAEFTVIGDAGRTITLMTSEDRPKDPVICLPILRGECLAITEPFEPIGTMRANANGKAIFTEVVPNATPDWVMVQAGSANNTRAWISQPMLVRVLDADGDEDGDGFSNGAEFEYGSDPLTPNH